MSLSLFDSRAQAVRAFEPIVAGKVGIYLCGPTVQGLPHVGHLRSALVYDQLRRWLTFNGQEVTLVRNVTDIDDKIIRRALENQETIRARRKNVGCRFDTRIAILRRYEIGRAWCRERVSSPV